jgi:quercetin dioxygenase-like cupin family protein
VQPNQLVPSIAGSELALETLTLEPGARARVADTESDSVLYTVAGNGSLTLDDASFALETGAAALVLTGEEATVAAGDGGLELLHATVGTGADRHALLGGREVLAALTGSDGEPATSDRSYRILFGPHNGSTRATLFVGYVPPGKAPWHFHQYDEIVWIAEGAGRLHKGLEVTELGPGSAFRLRPREAHIVENASPDLDLTLVGVFTPAGSPTAAYLAPLPGP